MIDARSSNAATFPLGLSMESAFLLVATKDEGQVPSHLERFTSQPRPPGLHFAPNDSMTWRSRGGQILVAAWQNARDRQHSRWLIDEAGRLTMVGGRWRRRGHAWSDPQRSNAEFATELGRVGVDELLRRSRGEFAAVSVDDDGGIVTCDLLGFHFLYFAESDRQFAVSSRAELAAWAVTPPGEAPRKDALAPCGLVYLRHAIGDATGFSGVRLLPEGSTVHVRAGSPPTVHARPASWLEGAELQTRTVDELLDLITDEITDELVAALSLPVATHFADLTGGKDSRLVLAVAITAGLASEFTFRTAGPPDLADVRIASRITGELGLKHESGTVFEPPPDRPYADRVNSFVAATQGTVITGHLKEPTTADAQLRVSGTGGECLRAHQKVGLATPVDRLHRVITQRRKRGWSLDLLEPDVKALLDAQVVRSLSDAVAHDPPADGPNADFPAADLLESFHIRNRARRQHGPMSELDNDFRVGALCSPEALRAAFALGAERRQNQWVHFELISRADPRLADIPFAGAQWPKLSRARLPSAGSHRPVDTPEIVAAEPLSPEPLIARTHRKLAGERADFLRMVFTDANNPVWDVVRRQRVLDALDRHGALSPTQRQQLHGVATAAIWLGHRQ